MSEPKSLTEPLTEEEEREMEEWISGMEGDEEQSIEPMRTINIDLQCGGEIRIRCRLPSDRRQEIGEELARLMQSA